jgi:hypothetical protein
MLTNDFGVRLLTKYDSEESSFLSAFIFTEFKEVKKRVEYCVEASEVLNWDKLKGERDIFHIWVGTMIIDDESGPNKKNLENIFDKLINYTENFIKNPPVKSNEYINHLNVFPDKLDLIEVFNDKKFSRT